MREDPHSPDGDVRPRLAAPPESHRQEDGWSRSLILLGGSTDVTKRSASANRLYADESLSARNTVACSIFGNTRSS